MANHPRWWRSDAIYSTVKRTVDRQFLLKPTPELRNLIGACLGRAQRRYPVKLYWAEANINHMQTGKSAGEDKLENLSRFDQLFYSLLTREINREMERDGTIWSTRNRSTICLDDGAVEQQLIYAMTNPVKDGLCQKVKHWSRISFSAYNQLAEGTRERFSYINWTKYHQSGGAGGKRKPEEFTEYVEVEFSPLPNHERLPAPKREAHIRREVRAFEQSERERRIVAKQPAMSRARLDKIDPRDRPKTQPKRTPKPLCHASPGGRRKEYEQEWNGFLNAYRSASGKYRTGDTGAKFPDGSFKPPLLGVCGKPMLC